MPRDRFGYEGPLTQEPEEVLNALKRRSRENAKIRPYKIGDPFKTGIYFSTTDLKEAFNCNTNDELKIALARIKVRTDLIDDEATRISSVGIRK